MHLPAWTDARGYPLSWGHFVVGLRRMAEESARQELRIAAGSRIAQSDERSWKGETRKLQMRAGVR